MAFSDLGAARSIVLYMFICVFNVRATETVVYSEGFEHDDGNYSRTGTPIDMWEWGMPYSGFTPGPDTAHSGNNCWGTYLDDIVPHNSNAYLTSPNISLPVLEKNQTMYIRFFGWIGVDFEADRGQFQISNDGSNWETKTELLLTMQGGWNEYMFNISDYAGESIYIRFRCFSDNLDNFLPPDIPENMAGFYVDDITITIFNTPAIKTKLTFEGSEDQYEDASCPWVYIKNKNGKFKKENDIFSTARGKELEYTDFYQLNKKPQVNKNGKLVIKLKETEQEESYIDMFNLQIVDHADNIKIACDEDGNVFTCNKKVSSKRLLTAIDNNGEDVLSLVKDHDGTGSKLYNGEYIDLDFGSIGIKKTPIFHLRAQGFLVDTTPGTPLFLQPKIHVQTQNVYGQWVTRNIFYPRWKFASAGYNLKGLFPYSYKVRLFATSCLTGKYHLIDWAAISVKPQQPVTITELKPFSAIHSDGSDVTTSISASDGDYFHMSSGELVTLKFDLPPKATEKKRDFIIKSKGYYIPYGTFYFYTWDGSRWAQRDAWSIPMAGDQTNVIDLSLWLPDPDGLNRVRIWQSYIRDDAAIDFVGLEYNDINLTMEYATDRRNDNSVLNLLNISDDNRLEWLDGRDWPERNRWVEVGWTGDLINTPPSTNPVFITNTNTENPIINWIHFDLDKDPQKSYEIEIWEGPDGTGENIWDPPVVQGTQMSEVYSGNVSFENGVLYFTRVKVFDGKSWGGWSEAAFMVGSNNPPVANAASNAVIDANSDCEVSVTLDGSNSTDSDGDQLSYFWTGPFGIVHGVNQTVFLSAGEHTIRLVVSDGKGSEIDSIRVVVNDVHAPIPDENSLPDITGECEVIITDPPTATDECTGAIMGITEKYTFAPGTHDITWTFDDGSGNVATQSQTIIVTDNIAPVPDVIKLPVLSKECSIKVDEIPTATDNCKKGPILGTTTDSLTYSRKGTYTITWNFIDDNNNSATQLQTVIVTDNIPPVPNKESLPTLYGSCNIAIGSFPTATDECAKMVIGMTTDPLTYTKTGTHTITWIYDDGNENIATQIQDVVIKDTVKPVPLLDTLLPVEGACSIEISVLPKANDDCRGIIEGSTDDPLKYTNEGTYTIHWTYDDGNGNIATQNQIVIVWKNGTIVPDIDPLPDIKGDCNVTIYEKPKAANGCNGIITATTTDPLSYFEAGEYIITWNYDNKDGNVSKQMQKVIVVDNVAPVPRVDPLPVIQGDCKVYVVKKPIAKDNCNGWIVGKTSDPLSYTEVGSYTITWTFTDKSGNESIQSQNVIVQDNIIPIPKVKVLPDIYGYINISGNEQFFQVTSYPSAVDNCKSNIVATTSSPLKYSDKGDFVIIWEYDDGNGHVGTQEQNIYIR